MSRRPERVPACSRRGHAGFAFRRLGLPLLLLACDPAPPPPVLVLHDDTIALPAGARIHDIDVRVAGDGDFVRARIEARPGDVLRFVTGDGRGHALVFDAATLTDSAAAFLDSTGQRRGPPLLSPGATWIVDLDGAPAGAYGVACIVHESRIDVNLTGR